VPWASPSSTAPLTLTRSDSRFALLLVLSISADRTPTQFLDALYESGCRSWDTANVYGDSEELLGKWCVLCDVYPCAASERAEKVQTYRKARRDLPRDQVRGDGRYPKRPGTGVNGDPTYMKECFEQSLIRLGGESERAARRFRSLICSQWTTSTSTTCTGRRALSGPVPCYSFLRLVIVRIRMCPSK
jgi:hypothetical protein